MSAILLALSGPYRGTTFKLTQDELSIGRDPSNGLCLTDFSASRRHCMIKKEADSFAIVDLDSRNGTFVNDIPAKQRKLEHTDQILIGNSLFVFLSPEQKMAPPETRFDEDVWIAKSTMELHLKDAIYLDPDRIATVLPSAARAAHDLNILLKVSTDLNSIRDLKYLKQKILEYLFQVIPAKRGAPRRLRHQTANRQTAR